MTHPEPLASDRRVLAIGAVAVVLFVTIGVVSASLLTASACRDLEPDPITVVDDGGDMLAATRAALAPLAGVLGAVSHVMEVPDATGVVAVDGGIAVLGAGAVVLDVHGEVARAVSLDGRVVGSGDQLFALAWVNDLTGQVDAVQPMAPSLEAGVCLDTAVVGEAFAFHLDARDDALALLRVEEGGDDPEVELRDASGRRWRVPVAMPIAPPGVLGERLGAVIAPGEVVVARRVGVGDVEPAIVALERADGALRWSLDVGDLEVARDEPVWLRPVGVIDDVVAVSLPAAVAGIDRVAGTVRWTLPMAGEPVATGITDDGLVVVVDAGGELAVVRVSPEGTATTLGHLPGSPTATVITFGDGVLVGSEGGWLVAADGEVRAHAGPPPIVAGAAHAGASVVVVDLGGRRLAVRLGG